MIMKGGILKNGCVEYRKGYIRSRKYSASLRLSGKSEELSSGDDSLGMFEEGSILSDMESLDSNTVRRRGQSLKLNSKRSRPTIFQRKPLTFLDEKKIPAT